MEQNIIKNNVFANHCLQCKAYWLGGYYNQPICNKCMGGVKKDYTERIGAIREFIASAFQDGDTENQIILQLQEQFDLNEEDARGHITEYKEWGTFA